MLYRKIEALIESHLKSSSKKILLIDGARQVGKTYSILEFGPTLSVMWGKGCLKTLLRSTW